MAYTPTVWSDGDVITADKLNKIENGVKTEAGKDGAAAGFGAPAATVSNTTGTPSVSVTASGPDTAKVFNFAFKNIKGATGATGATGAAGADGTDGKDGVAAGFGTPSATVSNTTGTPSVSVTASGPDTAKVFNFAFKNIKGATGATGAKGETGATGATGAAGADGADGKDGVTPTIGSNGNWYIGSTDTGKPSRGEQGEPGTISLLQVYPIGSIYISVSSTSPETLFGGTWSQIKDTFLLSAGTSYAAGTTGGEASHTLTADEIPAHYHDEYLGNASGDGSAPDGYSGWTSNAYTTDKTYWAKGSKTSSVGGGQPHNNMPPYLAVYMWKRTA